MWHAAIHQSCQPLCRRARSGFTLIEVLIAIALILALVGTMYTFLFDMLASRSHITEIARQETAAAAMIRNIESELMTCIVGDQVNGSGVKGDHRQLRILSRGVAAQLASRGPDDPELFGDLQLTEFRFDPQRKRIEARRGPVSSVTSSASGQFTAIEGEVHRVRFRYFDGQQWQQSFDSLAADRLPIAIEVAVWFRPGTANLDAEQPSASTSRQESGDETEADADADADVGFESLVEGDSHQADGEEADEESLWPAPDRVRVIAVPDAAGSPEESVDNNSPDAGVVE